MLKWIRKFYAHFFFLTNVYSLVQALQEGMATLMTLDDPSYFVGFVGICMDMPTRMILKETEYCNLRDFLRHRDPELILHQQHLNEATLCVANALLFMVGIYSVSNTHRSG